MTYVNFKIKQMYDSKLNCFGGQEIPNYHTNLDKMPNL